MLLHGEANINDYKLFHNAKILASSPDSIFQYASNTNFAKKVLKIRGASILDSLESTNARAFLVIQNDSIIYEWYDSREGYSRSSLLTSFSITKSFVSALIGIAIAEGKIKDVNDTFTTYLPEYNYDDLKFVTIAYLLQMRSGIKFSEIYKPKRILRLPVQKPDIGKLYYTRNIIKAIQDLEINKTPGEKFSYQSIDTQLLGMILRKIYNSSLASILQEKIWNPLGMESYASWSLDSEKNGVEKAFCCLQAIARDYAKFGRLYLNLGIWNKKEIIPKSWIIASTTLDSAKLSNNSWTYRYQWWIPKVGDGCYYAFGLWGQYIFVNPNTKLIIVKLSDDRNDYKITQPGKSIDFFYEINRWTLSQIVQE